MKTFNDWWVTLDTREQARVVRDDVAEVWEAATKAEREACAKVCRELADCVAGEGSYCDGKRAAYDAAERNIIKRSNVELRGDEAGRPKASPRTKGYASAENGEEA